MFHIELRQFPHVARAFNLTAEELQARVLSRWLAGQAVELEDRRWSPERAKLRIYEARALAGEEIGMGRGWGTVSREGKEVTDHSLRSGRSGDEADVKERLLAQLGGKPIALGQVVELTAEPDRRASERLALAEQAVWELLHAGRLELIEAGEVVPRERWQPLLLRWESWAPDGAGSVSVQAGRD